MELHEQMFKTVLDRYQEQPHLLDPHLPSLLSDVIGLVRSTEDVRSRHAAASFAAHIVKVRKAKVVVRLLPHEAKDVHDVLGLLEAEDPKAFKNWETRYFLLLWLSVLVLIPFDLARFDSGLNKRPLMIRILDLIKTYLTTNNKCLEAAAFLAARFLTRPEVSQQLLPEFLEWAKGQMGDEHNDIDKMGGLMAVASIYKHGKRDDLVPFAEDLLTYVQSRMFKGNANVLLRKWSLKVIQRLGLTFLKAKVASWRYQRGSRVLAVNLEKAPEDVVKNEVIEDEAEDEDYDIPDQIEDVIEELLCGLRDPKETVIRWSAAKGIGRITNRLPKALANEVVSSILELFTLRETDGAWHGGCLALAELGRRGLLLPERLESVVEVVLKALVYDEKKGSFSVGSHIRDAACYVCWSFARAYEPGVLKPHIDAIASALVTTTVFDREVNCRRAASAAFQEHVGRQGTFPHGIDILTVADYFAVGSRVNAYTKLAVHVAQFDLYRDKLVDHLVQHKVGHWDVVVRELAATALQNLCKVAKVKMVNEVLPTLLRASDGVDLFMKHGSIVAIGAIVHGLSLQGDLKDILDEDTLKAIKAVAAKVVEKLALRSTGGDLLRQAVTAFIEQCSRGKFPCHGESTADLWQAVLDENLSSPDPQIHEKAVLAFPHFIEEYYKDQQGQLLKEKRDQMVNDYLSDIDNSELHRRGISLALGSMPKFALEGRLEDILKRLVKCTEITKDTEKWAEGRRDAIIAINKIIETNKVSGELNEFIVEAMIKCLDDYTLDRRGDIGAWVREAAMNALTSIAELNLVKALDRIMPRFAQQAVEKIDRTRGLAAKNFAKLLFSDLDGIPHKEEVLKAFPRDFNAETFQFAVESETFPIFCRLLSLNAYRERLILGLVVSVGGLTERLVKHAGQSLFKELQSMEDVEPFCKAILNVFEANQKNDRVTVPMFKFLDQLLTSTSMEAVLASTESPFPMRLLTTLKAEIAKCGEPNKLMSSCDVLCALLQSANETAVKKSLVQLSIFLCHKFPRVRKVTANKLFEALLTYSEVVPDEDKLDEINSILSDTNWDQNLETLRPIRNKLCKLLDIPEPAVIKKVVA